MSTENTFKEAKRWFMTAADDLETAEILKNNKKYAHSCFHAQQAGEKALKAIWYYIDSDPWAHSIKMLIHNLKDEDKRLYEKFKTFEYMGSVLDRFYIPTRYPNGLPEMTPDIAFSYKDAKQCIEYSEKILNQVRSILKI
ncbi:MAG: HEPN domain-containing protein [Promethearchaeota archaeon]